MKIAVIHGPNLNLLGTRQPEIYGTESLDELEGRIETWGQNLQTETSFSQSNDESELVEMIQHARGDHDAILLNVGGFTHTSVAIADAVASVGIPTVEVHLSDINRREPWRRKSLIRPVAVRQISGRGGVGYRDAIRYLVNRSAMPVVENSYGPGEDNIIDVRGSGPRVLLVHGGFWLNPWERDSMESLAVALSSTGFTTGNVEYRRTPSWPESAQDVETAIRWFVPDGGPYAIVGHSAGGYLGFWAGKRRSASLVVGLAPVTDLVRAQTETDSAASLLETGAPPLAPIPDTHLLIHGTADELVDPDHSTRVGDDGEVKLMPGAGHFDLLRASGAHWETLLESLNRALQ